jgi:hypothetical protein
VKQYLKRLLTIVLAIIISVAFVTTVFAQAKSTPAQTSEKVPEKKIVSKTFKGELVNVDVATKTITAKDAKGEMTFDVAGIKKMVELKAGEKIMVMYTEKDGKMVAKTVVKQAAKK